MIKIVTASASSFSATVKSSVLANLLPVFSATTIWLVLCLAPPCIAKGVNPEDGGIGGRIKDAARITATPERVKVSEGSSSTDISWNTGDGSTGFVFVTACGRPPVLGATATIGNRLSSVMGRCSYGCT